MIPFMMHLWYHFDYIFRRKEFVTNILKLFVKLEVIESCKTALDLLEIDLLMEYLLGSLTS